METRDYNIETDGAQDNSTDDMQQAWTSDETSPVPADNKYKKAFDAFGQMFYADLIKERDELKANYEEEAEKNVRLREENDKLHRLTSNQALELQDCKDKIIQLQNLFNTQMQGEPTVSSDLLHFEYDVVHFDEYITPDKQCLSRSTYLYITYRKQENSRDIPLQGNQERLLQRMEQ